MPLGEGEAPRQDPIEQVQQNNNKPIEALQQMHLSPDMQNKINQDPELAQQINQTIEQLLSQATSEVGDQQPMQEALQKFLTSQENQKLKPEHIIAGLQALTSMTRDTKMGSLYDHATTVAQEKYHLALSTQAKIDEKQNILANQKEIGQEIDESIANQKEIGQEIDESIANQKEIGQEIKEMIKIAKQKADLIHGEGSENFQNAQQKVDQGLTIDESQLADYHLQRDDIVKLLTLQQNPNLADELQRQDDDQQKVLTYLSDGSFDGLKESLGIVESLNSAKKIDTLDDLAQDDAVGQIEGFDGAHDTEFQNIIQNPENQEKFGTLADKIIDTLPMVYQINNQVVQPDSTVGQQIVKDLSIPKEQQQSFLQGLRLSQLIRDRKINTETIKPEQYERVQTSHTILTQSLSTQTSDTIKDATQQNYLAHIANLFGSMGQDMDVNQSTISYDATQGLTIPFGIDGYEFHHPITIGEQLTGPKIFDRKDNQVDGNEITDTLHGVSLPTMGSIISTMSLADITDTNNYQDYQKSLESFATQQKSTLENDTASQKVSIQRYATELKAHLQGRQFATEFNTFNQTQNTANDYNDRPDQNNEQYQETYNLIDRTTESNSTTENKQLAQDLATLGSLPQRIKNIAQTSNDIDLSKSSDPWFQYLNMDNQYPNRSHELLSKFQKIGDKSPMDSKDLSLFVEYAQHIIDTKNPDITFDYYCKNIAKQQLSPHTQQLYSTDIRQAMETQSDQQDQADLASLDEQLEKVPEFFT